MSQLQPGRKRGQQWNRFKSYGLQNSKAFKSPIVGICDDTFNTGESKYAAQFNQSKVNIARYLQRQYPDKGYRVAQTVWTGQAQTSPLPHALPVVVAPDVHDPDDVLLRGIALKSVGKVHPAGE